MAANQTSLLTELDHAESIAASVLDDENDYGAVFTRRWVVDLILDLAGLSIEQDLTTMRTVEPSCGSGAFVVPIVERLVASAKIHGRSIEEASDALLATDLLAQNVRATRVAATDVLVNSGVTAADAGRLTSAWIQHRDFLLGPPIESADYVVGNPPYIRLEAVPAARSAAYRRACPTMGGRADIYVGFYERGLHALRENGVLAFICADRWMRNSYGAKLRALVSRGWSIQTVVSMTGVDAFEDEVDAYPAITVLRRADQSPRPLVVEAKPGFGASEAESVSHLAAEPHVEHAEGDCYRAARLHGWFDGSGGWPHGSPDRVALIADLEERFPLLEDPETGTRVGIGVATGADNIFIVKDAELVEPERLLRLAMPRDLAQGRLEWSGNYLVNPWDPAGLVDLADWPRMSSYLSPYQAKLAKRHTAKKGPWHKTIDRVIEGLAEREKLYLPDFKEVIFPVLDSGGTYPHHNLYWVTSDGWDMRVLGGLLLSDIANLFIEAYSVRMRGGFLRFQAQYLRRIRLPHRESVGKKDANALAEAFADRDRAKATRVALGLYGLRSLPA